MITVFNFDVTGKRWRITHSERRNGNLVILEIKDVNSQTLTDLMDEINTDASELKDVDFFFSCKDDHKAIYCSCYDKGKASDFERKVIADLID